MRAAAGTVGPTPTSKHQASTAGRAAAQGAAYTHSKQGSASTQSKAGGRSLLSLQSPHCRQALQESSRATNSKVTHTAQPGPTLPCLTMPVSPSSMAACTRWRRWLRRAEAAKACCSSNSAGGGSTTATSTTHCSQYSRSSEVLQPRRAGGRNGAGRRRQGSRPLDRERGA